MIFPNHNINTYVLVSSFKIQIYFSLVQNWMNTQVSRICSTTFDFITENTFAQLLWSFWYCNQRGVAQSFLIKRTRDAALSDHELTSTLTRVWLSVKKVNSTRAYIARALVRGETKTFIGTRRNLARQNSFLLYLRNYQVHTKIYQANEFKIIVVSISIFLLKYMFRIALSLFIFQKYFLWLSL